VSKTKVLEFSVQHYAGEVTYNSKSFVEKNKDVLHLDIIDLLCCSQNSVWLGF